MMGRWLLLTLLLVTQARGIVQETGTLRGFFLDTCSTCAYDNWLSHVTEGIARPGYNNYGPSHLDPQTNGFGRFRFIPLGAQGDSTVRRWEQVFDRAIQNQWQAADSLLARQDTAWNYELVQFWDTELLKEFYLFRERLDSSFVDVNNDTIPDDDVIGGFRNSWGLFVFNPTSLLSRSVMQVVHPQDDYIAPPVAFESFLRAEMAVFMIAGAGREVLWDTTYSQYTNARSLSDPSRWGRHPLQALTTVILNRWNAPPFNPLCIIQMHAFDHAAHISLPDVQVTAYHDDSRPNVPLRDLASRMDLVHALPRYPVEEIDGDTSRSCRVDQYLGLYCSPPYAYTDSLGSLPLASISDLLGAPDNQQAVAAHQGHLRDTHTENFIHVELDEYPDAMWQPPDLMRWLPSSPPPTWATYRHVLDYYGPFMDALEQALTWHASVLDFTPPVAALPIQATKTAQGTVYLRWQPAAVDRYFDTYLIRYDTTDISGTSPLKTRSSAGFSALAQQLTQGIQFSGLTEPVARYRFAVQARDLLGNQNPLSPQIGITDSTIRFLTLNVGPDSLALRWERQLSDSLYRILLRVPPDTAFEAILQTADTSYRLPRPDQAGSDTVSFYQVERVIRR